MGKNVPYYFYPYYLMEIKFRKSIKVLVILASIVLLVYLSYYIQGMYRAAQIVEVQSSLEHVWGFLVEQEDREDIKGITVGLGEKWRVLTQPELEKLATALSKEYYGEDKTANVLKRVLADRWNQQIIIVGRNLSCGSPEFIVWSKGPDGICSTTDDIIFPCPWNLVPQE